MTRNQPDLISCLSHLYTSEPYTIMASTLRSLRPLLRNATTMPIRRLPALQARGYKQPARDLMTGEVTQLPDIDVCPFHCLIVWSWDGADDKHTTVKVEVQRSPKQRPHHSKLIFGQTFTDHMLTIPWNSNTGWGTPEIKPCTSWSFKEWCTEADG